MNLLINTTDKAVPTSPLLSKLLDGDSIHMIIIDEEMDDEAITDFNDHITPLYDEYDVGKTIVVFDSLADTQGFNNIHRYFTSGDKNAIFVEC